MSSVETTEAPRPRLTQGQILSMLLQRGEAVESVTLTRNAKGETQIEVTARTRDGETLDAMCGRAETAYNNLRSLYPLGGAVTPQDGNGDVGAL